MKDFIKKNWQILSLELLVIIAFATFYGKFGDFMVDSFREVYIPQQMLKGEVLYKNIFAIYPPLAYLINAFLMKIFGNSQNILYFAGLFSTMSIIFYTNKIAQNFCKKFDAISICLFIIAGLVFSPNVFNAFFPYSYGILYGILFVLISIHQALNKKFPSSYFFYSLAILCKYEFVLLLPLLIIWSKNFEWKKNLATFLLPIFLTCVILIYQGLRIDDIKATFDILNIMSSTQTLYWFYSVSGLIFRIELIPIYIINFIKFLIPIYWQQYQEIIIWILPFISIGLIFRFKNLNINQRFFAIASILICAKILFALNLQSYGVYFIPFALISLYIITPSRFKKFLSIILIIWSLIIGGFNINNLCHKKTSYNIVIKYVKENTLPKDRVLVYPECLSINVLTNRNSDSKFYSLIPLYVETFGEDLIIKRLEKIKPEYIIINNYDTSTYYYKEFGKDYAQKILELIKKIYIHECTLREDDLKFDVYKRI